MANSKILLATEPAEKDTPTVAFVVIFHSFFFAKLDAQTFTTLELYNEASFFFTWRQGAAVAKWVLVDDSAHIPWSVINRSDYRTAH